MQICSVRFGFVRGSEQRDALRGRGVASLDVCCAWSYEVSISNRNAAGSVLQIYSLSLSLAYSQFFLSFWSLFHSFQINIVLSTHSIAVSIMLDRWVLFCFFDFCFFTSIYLHDCFYSLPKEARRVLIVFLVGIFLN